MVGNWSLTAEKPLETEGDSGLGHVIDRLALLVDELTRQVAGDAEDGVAQDEGVEVADAALDDALLHMARRVGDGYVLTAPQHGSEPLLGCRELEELDDVSVLVEPGDRRADAELDAGDRIGLVGDRRLLAPAQLALGIAENLEEELFLGGEVPVEDALADPEPLHDLRDR